MSPSPLDPAQLSAAYQEEQEAKATTVMTTDTTLTTGNTLTVTEEQGDRRYRVEPPRFNRAQRRTFSRYIAHKAKAQIHQAAAKHRKEPRQKMCTRCHAPMPGMRLRQPGQPGGTVWRCQCQVEQRRHCTMCHRAFMAPQCAWRENHVCVACADMLAVQRGHEDE